MHKGLRKKLDHEKGKLKAKAAQPDYRDRFVEEGDNFERGGSNENRITLADAARISPAFSKMQRDDKIRAIAFFERQMRSNFLKIGQWKFRFGLTPAKFAQENNIPAEQATKVFDDTKAQAEQRLSMTLGRARKAELQAVERLESRTGSPRVVWQLRFKTFLLPVEPIEWYRIYKRVELCPTEQESDE